MTISGANDRSVASVAQRSLRRYDHPHPSYVRPHRFE
jgi:hypothetical protein